MSMHVACAHVYYLRMLMCVCMSVLGSLCVCMYVCVCVSEHACMSVHMHV